MDYVDVIIKYSGDFNDILRKFNIKGEDLSEGFGIVVIPYGRLGELAYDSQVEYLEPARNLEYMLETAADESCITSVREGIDGYEGLEGQGIILGVIDSGIDFAHRDFLDEQGNSRILYIWDLSDESERLSGSLNSGREYNNAEINEILRTSDGSLSSADPLGHGTAVAGVMGGNGAESGGRFAGAAPKGEFVFVKLGVSRPIVTVDIMRGINYIARKSRELSMPAVINISYGTSNGSHKGSSLFEAYINSVADTGMLVIAAAAGNEGDAAHHYRGRVTNGESLDVKFNVSSELAYVYLSLWKDFVDKVNYELVSPDGEISETAVYDEVYFRGEISGVRVGVDLGRPSPYSLRQEVFIFLGNANGTEALPQGQWTLRMTGVQVVNGVFDVWLPTNALSGEETYFYGSDREITVTLPGTAIKALTVGAFNGVTGEAADFSGIGFNADDVVKPDILAPGVGVVAPKSGGGYDSYSGTSLASPIAAGAAALLIQWGVLRGNDPFMYGQRLKAFLRLGAIRDEGRAYPNSRYGYGRLCLKNSIEEAARYERFDLSIIFGE
ncbi:MAG: S8 family serine peptidase [Clostridiales bacterium]|nr:S8 family serine peptidase [Clostridiales bacterium]